VAKSDHRHFFHGKLLCGQQSCVPRQDAIVPVDQNWVGPAELLDRRCDAGHLLTAVSARGLFARGIRRSIGQRSIWISTLTAVSGTRRLDGKPDYRNDSMAL
jgi:hypothetical protein